MSMQRRPHMFFYHELRSLSALRDRMRDLSDFKTIWTSERKNKLKGETTITTGYGVSRQRTSNSPQGIRLQFNAKGVVHCIVSSSHRHQPSWLIQWQAKIAFAEIIYLLSSANLSVCPVQRRESLLLHCAALCRRKIKPWDSLPTSALSIYIRIKEGSFWNDAVSRQEMDHLDPHGDHFHINYRIVTVIQWNKIEKICRAGLNLIPLSFFLV